MHLICIFCALHIDLIVVCSWTPNALSLTGGAIASSRTKFDGVTSAVMIFEAAGCSVP
jgi:hypothetical protein